MNDIFYRAGGNPPVAAGMFTKEGARLCWWPAGYEASQENMEKVMALVWARDNDEPVSREDIRKLLGGEE